MRVAGFLQNSWLAGKLENSYVPDDINLSPHAILRNALTQQRRR